jgi:prepilin-type processing-associated H-X9-DG protein
MPQINCPHCGQVFDLTDAQAPQYAGQMITCTSCQKPFVVPALSASPMPPVGGPAMGGAAVGGGPVAYATPGGAAGQLGNGLAVASLVLALIGLCVPLVPAVVAIVLGILGLQKTRNPAVGGKGMAIAGIVIGAMSVLILPCMLAVMLPSLSRARETANRIKCASNMRQIGQALLLYANNNHGQYPPRLEDVLLDGNVVPQVFVCPTTNDTPAPGTTVQQQAAALSAGGHESYIYVPNLNSSVSPDTVLLYEPPTNHGSGSNILFGDGHVEFDPQTRAAAIIAELQAGFNPPRPGHY